MKFQYAITAFMLCSASSDLLTRVSVETESIISDVAAESGRDILEQRSTSLEGSRRLLTEACTLLLILTTFDDYTEKREVECLEPSTGVSAKISGGTNNQEKLLAMFDSNALTSNESTLFSNSAYFNEDEELVLPDDLNDAFFGENPDACSSATSGTKYMLAVRIIAKDASTTGSEADIRDSWFGTNGDSVNLKSQYEACSYGKLVINPADPNGKNGVYTVTITNNVIGASSSDIYRAAAAKVKSDLGSLNDFDHVMYCIPHGTSGNWIGYASLNSKHSVYNDNWCGYLSMQMHEIGHNMNLSHSGESDTYDDQSGMMGFSYPFDDNPIMCFNAPKNWQLGWYDDRQRIVNTGWEGNVYGITDYIRTNTGDTILIQIPGSTDWYVSFNRKNGINSGTMEGGDQVMVHRRPRGVGSGSSDLMAKLNELDSYNGAPLTITVNAINLSADPAFARITISMPTSISEKWRILVSKDTVFKNKRFDVYDLRFYSNDDCTGINHNDGKVIASKARPRYSVPERAFDTDIDSFWLGKADASNVHNIWIGMEFDTSVDVNCVSFAQGITHRTSSVKVQVMTSHRTWYKTLRTADLGENLVQDSTQYVCHNITLGPTDAPVKTPTKSPGVTPTESPDVMPTEIPVVMPTKSPVAIPSCSSKLKGPCLKMGCIYRKNKCESCAVLKEDIPCFESGCVWDKEQCTSCKDTKFDWPCRSKGCVWKKNVCSSCRAVLSEKKCAKSKCAWKLQTCIPCAEVKHFYACLRLNCNWNKKGCVARFK